MHWIWDKNTQLKEHFKALFILGKTWEIVMEEFYYWKVLANKFSFESSWTMK